MKVYLLEHIYELEGHDEVRTLGIYSSNKKAEEAILYYKKLSGFKNLLDGFNIDEYEINERCWTEGFFTAYY